MIEGLYVHSIYMQIVFGKLTSGYNALNENEIRGVKN